MSPSFVYSAVALPAVVGNVVKHFDPRAEFTETRTKFNGLNSFTLLRLYESAADTYGQRASFKKTIIVKDTTPPVLNAAFVDVTIESKDVPSFERVSAADNCDHDVSIVIKEVRFYGFCENAYELART